MADLEKITKKRLGEILVAQGIVTSDQVQEALKIQSKTGEKLGEALVKAGFTTETEIAKTLCTQFAKPFLKASRYDIARDVLSLLPPKMLIEHQFVPVDKFGNMITIVMAGLLDASAIAQIQHLTHCEIEIYIGTSSDVMQTLRSGFPDFFDPHTQAPKLAETQYRVEGDMSAATRMGSETSTRDLMSLAVAEDENSDWEALFEEAEKEVMRELKEKKSTP